MTTTINDTIQELQTRGVLDGETFELRRAKGTTEGQVCLLAREGRPLYVLKRDETSATKRAAQFLARYSHSPLLPALRFADPGDRYLLYDYVEGSANGTRASRGRKADWMGKLVRELFNLYTPEQSFAGFGERQEPCGTWSEFNRRSLEFAKERIGAALPPEDHAAMERLWRSGLREWKSRERYALHGDAGVHNFIFHRGELAGVVDPSPAAGPLLYDFAFAFCSSPDDLNAQTLLEAYAELREKPVGEEELMRETAFRLYCRIAVCLLHHPQDLPEYMQAWPYWRTVAGELEA